MKLGVQIRLSQNITLTPQLQQSIRLLQLSTLELEQELLVALQENPLLERDEESDLGPDVVSNEESAPATTDFEELADLPRLETDEISDTSEAADSGSETGETGSVSEIDGEEAYPLDTDSFAESADDWTPGLSSQGEISEDYEVLGEAHRLSLKQHVLEQTHLSPLSERDQLIMELLIDALDDDGYLRSALEDILATLGDEELEIDDLNVCLHYLQSFDPAGVGARDLRECLALQLKHLPEGAIRDRCRQLVDSHLDLLAQKDFTKLKRQLKCSDDQLRLIQSEILKLNPRPGARFAKSETRYVIADVVVKKHKGEWLVLLNQNALPRLRINQMYADMLGAKRGDATGMSTQLQEARWLLKNVQQRFDTIQRVSQAIVNRQTDFLERGELGMRPLTLREVADELGLHESTISRVTTQKYMATPRGVFEFKYFFGSHVSNDQGDVASSTAIKAQIRQLIDAEERKKPLSDARLAELLDQQGVRVARRTVAKYREQLNIPPVSQRKVI